ncbi:hypothetical protein IWW54_004270, partial [Coemansia sp. RSA 2705]
MSLHEWVSDKLIDLIGESSSEVIDYVLHLAAQSTSEQSLTRQLEAADLPKGQATAQFAHELYLRTSKP